MGDSVRAQVASNPWISEGVGPWTVMFDSSEHLFHRSVMVHFDHTIYGMNRAGLVLLIHAQFWRGVLLSPRKEVVHPPESQHILQ